MTHKHTTYCGYIALVGRPNVGKSTLLNHLLSQKISITSRKPQTTRHRVLGIHTQDQYQTVYVDTPGLHQTQGKKALNRYLNRAAKQAIFDVDLIVFVIEAFRFTIDDQFVLDQIKQADVPVILVVNKIDQLADQNSLLPFLKTCETHYRFSEIVPLSAIKKLGLSQFQTLLHRYLPESPHFFGKDQLTDRSDSFLISEIIREKLTRLLGQELPYALSVDVEQLEKANTLIKIGAIIWTERDSQKGIIIGKSGTLLKKVGQQARLDLEKQFKTKVFLQLWVKTKRGWSDDVSALKRLGYGDGE